MHNVNADTAAAALAVALQAAKLVVLTDIEGLYADWPDRGSLLSTVTAVRPPGRFGRLVTDGTSVLDSAEKPDEQGGWINGGFFVLNRAVEAYLAGDDTVWEREPLETLAREGELQAFFHHGFWQPMDTLRDRQQLEALWQSGAPPWKTWR